MVYMCFFDCRCKNLNKLGENIFLKKNIKKQKSFEKNIKTEIQDIQPTNLREAKTEKNRKKQKSFEKNIKTEIQDIQPTNLREAKT